MFLVLPYMGFVRVKYNRNSPPNDAEIIESS
jgi:hypothetical protein